jgi:ketosteroid isomerase-like protein
MLKTAPFLFALICAPQLIASPAADSPGRARTAGSASTASPASDEAQIWSLEKAYWEYVKTNDLEKYRALWDDDFVGWPSVSPEPVRKNHITDWITNNTSQGLKLQSYAIEQLAVHVSGEVAIDHYRIKANWAKGNTGDGGVASKTDAVRITHTWIRSGNTWQIIGGMSAPVNSEGK